MQKEAPFWLFGVFRRTFEGRKREEKGRNWEISGGLEERRKGWQ